MIESFEIKNQNGEEILYVYVSYQYEFGKELFASFKEKGVKKQIQDWVEKNNITFHGKKVMVFTSGILLASFLLQSGNMKPIPNSISYMSPSIVSEITQVDMPIQDTALETQEKLVTEEITPIKEIEDKEVIQANTKEDIKKPTSIPNEESQPIIENEQIEESIEASILNPITIYRNGVPFTLSLEDYVVGVVAAEMPASFPIEALKAQAVLARTYALKLTQEGKKLTDSTDTQVYYDASQLQSMWGSSYETYYNKIKKAVANTNGQTLTYQGNYIDAVYHSTSNGKTEAARNVWGYEIPYLQSVDSHWDNQTTFYHGEVYKERDQLLSIFGITNLEDGDVEVMSRNESGRVKEVRVQSQIYQGVDLRALLGLKSSDFDIVMENGNLVITTRGWGHGVGMSQYGALGMANEGYSCQQILTHYYPGTNLN